MKPPKLGVHLVGKHFIRFIISAEDGTYWTGGGWSPHRGKSLLYAHIEVVQADLHRIKRSRRKPRF
jgi:hypothetical protein